LLDYWASRSVSEEVMGYKVSKVRQCHECKEVFATPDSFRQHKYMGGHCRSVEALNFAGFVKTSKGWKKVNEAT
jgi:hypothetical protein